MILKAEPHRNPVTLYAKIPLPDSAPLHCVTLSHRQKKLAADMKRMGAFGFFMLFLAGIAIVNLRNMADQTAASVVEPQLADLVATPWRLQRLTGEQPSPDASFELRFSGDNSLSLRAACNRYNGEFTYANGQLRVGNLAGTRRACEPDIMQADQLFLDALQSEPLLSLAGNRLLLKSPDDNLIAVLQRDAVPATTGPGDNEGSEQ